MRVTYRLKRPSAAPFFKSILAEIYFTINYLIINKLQQIFSIFVIY